MNLLAFFFELFPLAGFFAAYHLYGIFSAAIVGVSLSIIIIGISWYRDNSIAPFPLFSLITSILLTGMAVLLGDAVFIKMQPTFFNGLFGILLLGGLLIDKPMMRSFFSKQFQLSDRTWYQLSFRWGCFLFIMAIGNEIVWRNNSEAFWVGYRTFVAAPAVLVFMLSQLPLTLKGRM
ncbi:MAG: intracellular septation protein A [Proteobacteria bacterium]|nr:intracellular septation protein A [Pseudomonadota bacterium]